ncbi:helix-turn-helix domain-containing protein [Hyphomonadaceae bacterium BL14]|nr:helix-turn-helix domain-containing protein [Hyphomonadaceae bacterium BL14]
MDEDRHLEVRKSVGARIRRRRTILGWTLADLAEPVGCRYQQIQKYETGANEIGVVRLLQIAEALDVDVQYFFADLQTLGSAAMRDLELDESSVMRIAKNVAKLPPRVQDRFCLLASAVVSDREDEDPVSPQDDATD